MKLGLNKNNPGVVRKLEEIVKTLIQDRKVIMDAQLRKGENINRDFIETYLTKKLKDYLKEYKI